ncbi:MAG: hypothetical protein Q9221_008325, partial [Calogaya cf. arnoldii]
LGMIARLGGMVFGAWLMRNGAAMTMLLGVTLSSTILPILSFLPSSTARSSQSGESQRTSAPALANCSSDGTHSTASPPLGPRRSTSKGLVDEDQQVDPLLDQSGPSKVPSTDFSKLSRSLSHIPFDNPLYLIYLAIMFFNSLAMDVRGQLRPWTSKRYDWSLATVSYILSVESALGVGILSALPWLDRIRRPVVQSVSATSRAPTRTDAETPVEDEAMSNKRAVLAKRRRELLVARVSLGLGTVGALMLALATSHVAYIAGVAVMTGAVGFPDAIRAFITGHFATDDIQGLYASVTVVEALSIMVGSPTWGAIYARAYRGASEWIGAPLGVCAVLLLCTLGLTLRLKV